MSTKPGFILPNPSNILSTPSISGHRKPRGAAFGNNSNSTSIPTESLQQTSFGLGFIPQSPPKKSTQIKNSKQEFIERKKAFGNNTLISVPNNGENTAISFMPASENKSSHLPPPHSTRAPPPPPPSTRAPPPPPPSTRAPPPPPSTRAPPPPPPRSSPPPQPSQFLSLYQIKQLTTGDKVLRRISDGKVFSKENIKPINELLIKLVDNGEQIEEITPYTIYLYEFINPPEPQPTTSRRAPPPVPPRTGKSVMNGGKSHLRKHKTTKSKKTKKSKKVKKHHRR